MRILVVEDEPKLNELITARLRREHYSIDSCLSGDAAMDYLACAQYDLLVLDIMLPGISGLEILRSLRGKDDKTPVLLLTALDSIPDRVSGLDSGADDYLVKPFGMMEMVARIKAVLRRTAPKAVSVLTCGEIVLDEIRHTVTVDRKLVSLTLKEYELLKLLMENPGQVFTRDVLLSRIWGQDYLGETRTVDVHIGTLRTKLAGSGEWIETVRGVGYKMVESHE